MSRLVCFLAANVLLLSPWWLHNQRLHGRFIPLDTTSGLNLAIGSAPDASGRWYWSHVEVLLTTDLRGIDVTTPEGSGRATALAIDYVRAAPLAWLKLAPAKTAALLAVEGRETAYLYSLGLFGEHSSNIVLSWAIAVMLSFPALLIGAVGGLTSGQLPLRFAGPVVVLMGTTVLMHIATFGDPRFHLPLVPLLAIAATHAKRIDRRALVATALACALLAPAWYAQAVNYMPFVRLLMTPGASHSPVSFDALF
ncbi:MAG: hypothetical protein U0P30_14230 [Vicinamibacterales bacterium]